MPTEERPGSDTATRGGPQRIPRPPGTRLGHPPPWRDLADRRFTLAEVRAALEASAPPRPAPIEALPDLPPLTSHRARASAVLAPLYDHEGEAHVILTRRAWHLRSHTGEVSFPGGRREDHDDTLWHTAVRESQEEVALDPGAVEHVGELDHLSTVTSRSFIVPYVGFLDGRPDLTPDPGEVDAILHVPLSELMHPEVYRQERWGLPGVDRPIHFFELYGDTVWGATGSMLVDLLDRIVRHR